jgi:hypothetical protein
MSTWTFFPLSATRYSEPAEHDKVTGEKISDACSLYYGKQQGVGWRLVVLCDGSYSQVGATYATKDELLADLPRYAATWSKNWR